MKKSLLVLSLLSSTAFAGICELSITREACPGKEKESYVKCGGEKSCKQKKKADDEAACKKIAEEACFNDRLDITKSKVITATFAGKTIDNVCKADRPDFNKCSK